MAFLAYEYTIPRSSPCLRRHSATGRERNIARSETLHLDAAALVESGTVVPSESTFLAISSTADMVVHLAELVQK